MPGRVAAAGCLKQEPDASFGFVNPGFDQAGGSNVVVLIAKAISLAQSRYKRLVVVDQLGKHVLWLDVLGVIV